jgi:hypothetical protein
MGTCFTSRRNIHVEANFHFSQHPAGDAVCYIRYFVRFLGLNL